MGAEAVAESLEEKTIAALTQATNQLNALLQDKERFDKEVEYRRRKIMEEAQVAVNEHVKARADAAEEAAKVKEGPKNAK